MEKPALPKLLTGSALTCERPVREIVADLERIDPAPGCRLLPVDECRAVIAAHERAQTRTAPDTATELAATLIGVYRRDDLHDPDVYIRAIAATLAEYPVHIAKRVASPVTGIPARMKFIPAVAEVREALDAEDRRQRNLAARAKWMIQERERRDADKRAITAAPSIRAEQVDEILARVRRSMSESA